MLEHRFLFVRSFTDGVRTLKRSEVNFAGSCALIKIGYVWLRLVNTLNLIGLLNGLSIIGQTETKERRSKLVMLLIGYQSIPE